MTSKRIWRLPEVIARTGLSRSTIYQKMSENKFPRKINLGARSIGFVADEVEGWILARIEEARSVDQLDQPTR